MIKIRNLEFEYFERDDEGNLTDMVNAIREINFDAQKGDFIVIAGRNGSGKSTLAKILNRLLVPVDGTVIIGGLDAKEEENIIPIRKKVGMVFQNPEDQLIGTIVAEDVAFGAENLGVPSGKLWERVFSAIKRSGLLVGTYKKQEEKEIAFRKIDELSGGEKQKVAIAGILAMKPECIVLDESTSMLDQMSRKEILRSIKELNEKEGVTVILITHIMEELLYADYIYIMQDGKIKLKGRKEKIFSEKELLEAAYLDLPEIIKIKNELMGAGVLRGGDIYDPKSLVARLKKEHPYKFELDLPFKVPVVKPKEMNPKSAILVDDVSFQYGKKSNARTLSHVTFHISKGEYALVVGGTGAGKSTLLQMLIGLLKPIEGSIYVDGMEVTDSATKKQNIRKKIGYVFQYPEQQLFARNVFEDVVFGPRNLGVSEIEAEKRAYEAIELVGLPQDVYDIPISKLSGGQKRRVALAGVLAMKPEYLILDEPLAGLDPHGKEEMLAIIDALHKDAGITILMVTHDYDFISDRTSKIIVLNKGELAYQGTPEMAFYNMWKDDKEFAHLPTIMQVLVRLRLEGLPVNCFIIDKKQGINEIIRCLK